MTRRYWIGLGVTVALMLTATLVPLATGWEVRSRSFSPLHAEWMPRLAPATVAAAAVAIVVWLFAVRCAATLRWGRLLLATFVAGIVWMVSLALVDGTAGITAVLDADIEYLQTARSVTDIGALLSGFIERIPAGSSGQWPVHVAGHPPGALLVFVALVRVGLGSGAAAGVIVIAAAASTAVAVLITLRTLGAESLARKVAPFVAFGPFAIWQAVSADALFAAVVAWATCLLALAAVRRRWWTQALLALASGLVYGYAVFLSYGFLLVGVLAVAVLIVARALRPLWWAIAGALVVVAAFALAGFAWWEAYPVLVERYWAGIASERPLSYWIWGNLAAFAYSAGPVVGMAVVAVAAAWRSIGGAGARHIVVTLAAAGIAMVALADLSGMSKAEVERIWLPFVPWVLLGVALIPDRLIRPALAVQLVAAIVLQHLVYSQW